MNVNHTLRRSIGTHGAVTRQGGVVNRNSREFHLNDVVVVVSGDYRGTVCRVGSVPHRGISVHTRDSVRLSYIQRDEYGEGQIRFCQLRKTSLRHATMAERETAWYPSEMENAWTRPHVPLLPIFSNEIDNETIESNDVDINGPTSSAERRLAPPRARPHVRLLPYDNETIQSDDTDHSESTSSTERRRAPPRPNYARIHEGLVELRDAIQNLLELPIFDEPIFDERN